MKLDKLDRFNVLIGRNNSGKSSVFGALQLLNSIVNNMPFDPQRVLTDLDVARSLEIHMTFETKQPEREAFLDLVYATPDLSRRKEEARNSPLLRQIQYLFRAPEGHPGYLRPHEIRLLAEDGQWAAVQRIVNFEVVANPYSWLTNINAIRSQYPYWVWVWVWV